MQRAPCAFNCIAANAILKNMIRQYDRLRIRSPHVAGSVLFALALAGCSSRCGAGRDEAVPAAASEQVETLGSESFGAPARGTRPTQRGVEDPIVAWVNEVDIHRSQLQEHLNRRIEVYRSAGNEDGPRWRNAQRRNIARHLVEQEVFTQAVDLAGVTLTDEELDSALSTDISDLYGSQVQFDRHLARRGMTYEEYRELRRFEIRIQTLFDQRGATTVSDEEVHAYYQQVRDQWRSPERINASSITVRLRRNPPEAEVEDALERIRALRDRANEGEDFAVLAEAHSESANRYQGGAMGWIFAGDNDLEEPVLNALFSLPAGEISEPIRTRLGFQIFLVSAHQEAGPREYEEIRDNLRSIVQQQAQQRIRNELIAEMEEQLDIGYAEGYLGLEPEEDRESSQGQAPPSVPSN